MADRDTLAVSVGNAGIIEPWQTVPLTARICWLSFAGFSFLATRDYRQSLGMAP